MVPSNGTFCEPTLSASPHTVDLDPHSSISSVAVEHSYTSDENRALPPKHTTESELRPAAEVFGFLLEKRRSISMAKGLSSSTPSPWGLNSSTGHVHDAPTTPSKTKRSSSHFGDLRPAEMSASGDTPSTLGSILVDPPHTATILNHTRIPVLQGRLHEGSNTGQPTDMAIATRASRIPRERRNLQIPSGRRASTSETYLSPTEPVKPTPATAYRSGAISSANKAINHPPTIASHLFPEEAALPPPVPMRSAHRRSASYGSNRPIPREWDAGLDAIRMARVKGLKSGNVNKENIVNTLDNGGMRPLSSFALM